MHVSTITLQDLYNNDNNNNNNNNNKVIYLFRTCHVFIKQYI